MTINMLMKATIVIITFLFGLSLCTKESEFLSRGTIIGPDLRRCACWGNKCGCCGNWVIQINDTGYLFVDLPKSPAFDLNQAKFTLNISLDWHKDPDSCALRWGYIIIDRFKID